MGQAVLLPARFTATAFRPGRYAAKARLLTQDGPRWFDMGRRETDAQGVMDLSGGPPGTACDMFVLESGTPDASAGIGGVAHTLDLEAGGIASPAGGLEAKQALPLDVRRVNQSRYQVSGELRPEVSCCFRRATTPGGWLDRNRPSRPTAS